ncbi:MAG: hypothetical protein KBD78_11495 [Oligoflexales bacterium]|nr:hypothetical protein [Oligoflexales bacterium]
MTPIQPALTTFSKQTPALMQANSKYHIQTTIPGKILLAGEYSVLFGGTALAATVNSCMQIQASSEDSLPNSAIRITSDLWTQPIAFDKEAWPLETNIVLSTLKNCLYFGRLQNLDLHIDTGIDHRHGFGSSSALRLGIIAAIKILAKQKFFKNQKLIELNIDEKESIALRALEYQRADQTLASGYDIITQLMGGLIEYKSNSYLDIDAFKHGAFNQRASTTPSWPGVLRQDISKQTFDNLNRYFHVFVGGAGAPTKSSIQLCLEDFLEQEQKTPGFVDKYFHLSQDLIFSISSLLNHKIATENDSPHRGLDQLISILSRHRKLLETNRIFPLHLLHILEALPGFDKTWSFKTTGAGGEDAILLIGEAQDILAATEALKLSGWSYLPNIFSPLALSAELMQ